LPVESSEPKERSGISAPTRSGQAPATENTESTVRAPGKGLPSREWFADPEVQNPHPENRTVRYPATPKFMRSLTFALFVSDPLGVWSHTIIFRNSILQTPPMLSVKELMWLRFQSGCALCAWQRREPHPPG
jgi:hypothetical protein